MRRDKHIIEELEELSPMLAKLKKEVPKAGFEVPPTYFKDLTAELMDVVEQEKMPLRQGVWWEVLMQWLQPRALNWGLASIAILLVAMVFWPRTEELEVATIDWGREEVEIYVEMNLEEFELDLFLEDALLLELEESSDEELEEYLLETEDLELEDWL